MRKYFGFVLVLCVTLAVPTLAQVVDGAGTTNYIARWTGSSTIANSRISQTSSGTTVIVGPNGTSTTIAPTVFQVVGGNGVNSTYVPDPGGAGGGVQIAAGNGGSDTSYALGGKGAIILMTGGSGGQCIVASTRCGFVGGNGGSIALLPGAGGGGNVGGQRGFVGIGTTTPANTLEVVIGGSTLADHWTTRSSIRFKTDIQPLEGALEKIQNLRGVAYKSTLDGKQEIGVVAEEVVKVVPEVVSRDPNHNEIQGVDYSRLTALLIEAVKSQQAEIKQLKVRISELTSDQKGRATRRH